MTIHKGELLNQDMLQAAAGGDIESVRNLLQSGACPNAVDNSGKTALHYAALNGNDLLTDILVESGANIEQGIVQFTDLGPEMTELTPVEQAAWNGQLHIIEKLVAYGADLDTCDELSNTLLMRAISFGHNALAAKLIELGADLNAKNFLGRTALHIAVEQTNRELTKLLIEKGAKTVPDYQEQTPLSLGEKNGFDILITKTQKDLIIKRTTMILNKIFKAAGEEDAFEINVIEKNIAQDSSDKKTVNEKKASHKKSKDKNDSSKITNTTSTSRTQ
ncbi:MAG: ankyrin repeat domain-containing protein [Rickettsiales bacterium]